MTVMKDPSKPYGKAVNADGSLKDAQQIKWLNSPTDESHPPNTAPILGPKKKHKHFFLKSNTTLLTFL